MVVRRKIIESAAEYENWERLTNSTFGKCQKIGEECNSFYIHGAVLFLCAVPSFLISNFSFLILEKRYGDL